LITNKFGECGVTASRTVPFWYGKADTGLNGDRQASFSLITQG
jgi:hypothetical protein